MFEPHSFTSTLTDSLGTTTCRSRPVCPVRNSRGVEWATASRARSVFQKTIVLSSAASVVVTLVSHVIHNGTPESPVQKYKNEALGQMNKMPKRMPPPNTSQNSQSSALTVRSVDRKLLGVII